MNHAARLAVYSRRAKERQGRLAAIPGLKVELSGSPVTGLTLRFGEAKNPAEIAKALRDGDPSIWLASSLEAYLRNQAPGTLRLSVAGLVEGDIERIERRLREILAAQVTRSADAMVQGGEHRSRSAPP